jgi:hypothetical protein
MYLWLLVVAGLCHISHFGAKCGLALLSKSAAAAVALSSSFGRTGPPRFYSSRYSDEPNIDDERGSTAGSSMGMTMNQPYLVTKDMRCSGNMTVIN